MLIKKKQKHVSRKLKTDVLYEMRIVRKAQYFQDAIKLEIFSRQFGGGIYTAPEAHQPLQMVQVRMFHMQSSIVWCFARHKQMIKRRSQIFCQQNVYHFLKLQS